MTPEQDHECEPDDHAACIIVELYVDAIHPLCPHRDKAALAALLEQHGHAIAAHMFSAGVEAAARLFQTDGGLS